MINAALNWTSLCAIALIIAWFFSVPASGMQIWFLLNRRADLTPVLVIHAFIKGAVGILRLLGMPIAALILLFQGWRLAPILQLGVLTLVLGWISEITGSTITDYSAMKRRVKG